MRQAEKDIKKKFQSQIPLILDQGKKIPKKNSKKSLEINKTSFQHYFQPKRDEIGRKREKKKLIPDSVHTRHGDENSEQNSKRIQKLKQPLSGIIFSQNQIGREREKIILFRNFFHTRPEQENSEKNNLKNQKTTFQHYFQPKRDEIGRKREKKKQSRIPFVLNKGMKLQKKIAK